VAVDHIGKVSHNAGIDTVGGIGIHTYPMDSMKKEECEDKAANNAGGE